MRDGSDQDPPASHRRIAPHSVAADDAAAVATGERPDVTPDKTAFMP